MYVYLLNSIATQRRQYQMKDLISFNSEAKYVGRVYR